MEHDAIPAGGSDTPPTHGLFRREGEYWTLDYGGTTCRLHDTTGMRHLAHLLARPGQKVAATALVQAARRRWQKRPRGEVQPDRIAAATQRARVRVTRAVRAAMARIEEHHPSLGEHLAATIKTGAYCVYAPDLRIAPAWTVTTRTIDGDGGQR